MKPIVIGALVIAAFVGGVLFFKHDWNGSRSAVTTPSGAGRTASDSTAAAGSANEAAHDASAAAGSAPDAAGSGARVADSSSGPAPSDPRLAAFAVSQDNGLVQFVRAPDGKVIAEIDKDPASLGFGKPSREYLYSGNKVVGLTAYRYFADHVEINRSSVSYKPDGSVDHFAESTSTENGKRK